jgi:hypothetical protein
MEVGELNADALPRERAGYRGAPAVPRPIRRWARRPAPWPAIRDQERNHPPSGSAKSGSATTEPTSWLSSRHASWLLPLNSTPSAPQYRLPR